MKPRFDRSRIKWSKSRQGTFEECPREYFYTYIGRYENSEEGRRIASLVALKKLPFFKGNAIHDAIRNQICQHILKRPVNIEAARNFIKLEFARLFNSQEKTLSESYNGFGFSPEQIESQYQDAARQIELFFLTLWPTYSQLELLTHEKLEQFSIGDIDVWVQPDLVSKNSAGEFVISDWKTGSSDSADADNDLQLSVYSLWACEYFKISVEQVRVELVFLKTGQSFASRRTNDDLERLKGFISTEARALAGLKKKEELLAKPRQNACKGCNFSRACVDSTLFRK